MSLAMLAPFEPRLEPVENVKIKNKVFDLVFYFGTPDRIRTYDLLLRKQTLYPAELRVHMWMFSL